MKYTYSELSKEAGIRDALKVLLTGRTPLFHGTSKPIAKQIMSSGLVPGGSPGITQALSPELARLESGLSFLTRSPANARSYAQQQAALETVKSVRGSPTVSKALEGLELVLPKESLDLHLARAIMPFHRGKVLKASVPRSFLQQNQAFGLEAAGPNMGPIRNLLKEHPILEQGVGLPFISDVPVKGGLPPQYIKGSPSYQGITVPELKQHFQSAVADPKALGKDTARALLGVSHRPSTILEGADAAKKSLKPSLGPEDIDLSKSFLT